jgi:hypothetical protein
LLVARIDALDISTGDPGAIRLGVVSKGLRIVFTKDVNANIRSCQKLRQVLLHEMLLAAYEYVGILSSKLPITALEGGEAALVKSS